MKTIGEVIRENRKRMKLTQVDISNNIQLFE